MKNERPKTTIAKQSLSLCFPVHRIIDCRDAKAYMYVGMALSLVSTDSRAIMVAGFVNGQDQIVGIIPKGMMPHLDDVLLNPYNFCIQLEEISCTQLVDKMWIRIDQLPQSNPLPV